MELPPSIHLCRQEINQYLNLVCLLASRTLGERAQIWDNKVKELLTLKTISHYHATILESGCRCILKEWELLTSNPYLHT